MPPKITKKLAPSEKINKTKAKVNKNEKAKSSPRTKSDEVSESAKVLEMDKAEKTSTGERVQIVKTISKSRFEPTFFSNTQESQPNRIDISKETLSELKKSHEKQLNYQNPGPNKILRIADLSADKALELAIAEIESEGSSDESEDYSHYYHQQSQEDDFIINDLDKILVPDIISEDESSINEDPAYLNQNELELEQKQDFFGELRNVPQVDELSTDSTIDLILTVPAEKYEIKQVDSSKKGQFVNPLTGISSSLLTTKSSKNEVQEIEEELQQLEEEVEEVHQELSEHSEDMKSIIEFQETESDFKDLKTSRDDVEAATFNQFLEIEAEINVEKHDVVQMSDKINEELNQQNFQHCLEFITKLIDRCVDQAEYIDSANILRRNLDNRKLLQELKIKLPSLTVENSVKQFLNRKCVEHFRRKRTFRPIMNDNPKTLTQDIHKFNAACSDLDKWLIKEEKLKSSGCLNLENLRKRAKAAEDQSKEEVLKFENLLRESFKRDNFDKLQTVVNNSLIKMSLVRNEISQTRFRLILQQHKEALLEEKMHDLEDLGNGLSMRNFENMQAETQALGKKIEERNAELQKLHFRCNTDIHNLAHLKEKQKMLHHTIAIQKQYLEECFDDKEYLRETINELKLKRNRIRQEIRDLSIQCGLLDKPILMRDYDKTTEIVEELQKKVDGLKMTVNRLNAKIYKLDEINCKRKS